LRLLPFGPDRVRRDFARADFQSYIYNFLSLMQAKDYIMHKKAGIAGRLLGVFF